MHLMKNTAGDAKRILNEAFRRTDSKSDFYNKNLSINNKYVWNREEAIQRLEEKIKTYKPRNKRTIITITAVITLPEEVKQEDQQKFWSIVKKYHDDKLGKDNLIYANIHNDEYKPHMHMAYVPIKNDKFNAKAILNQEFFMHYHLDLQNEINKHFDYHITIERTKEQKEQMPRIDFEEYKKQQIEKERQNLLRQF